MYNYKNKNIGILGLGVTGRSAINFFSEYSNKILVWDDLKKTRTDTPYNLVASFFNFLTHFSFLLFGKVVK